MVRTHADCTLLKKYPNTAVPKNIKNIYFNISPINIYNKSYLFKKTHKILYFNANEFHFKINLNISLLLKSKIKETTTLILFLLFEKTLHFLFPFEMFLQQKTKHAIVVTLDHILVHISNIIQPAHEYLCFVIVSAVAVVIVASIVVTNICIQKVLFLICLKLYDNERHWLQADATVMSSFQNAKTTTKYCF